ncbi:MAG: aspartate 1-decarboxylase [Candidatus Latescibacteria bacterium]|nr:aspartate 1-decarboxylase [bacterium]MBD3424783.1 aspartate 1-decarboxylase [Candidatus Latescibacterota bacterium]
MKRLVLKSMIMNARVTQADLRYVGSITIDEDLIEKADLSEQENVLVVDRTNGNRLQTYVIKGRRGSGVICMNGAAAHLVKEGDAVDIMTFAWTEDRRYPLFIRVDESNRFSGYYSEDELQPSS